MATHRILITLLACCALPACQWVDSTGTQSRNGNGDTRFAPVIALTEEIPGQLDFTGQLPEGSYSRGWNITDQGVLPACAANLDSANTANSLEAACTALEENCQVIIVEQSDAAEGGSRYTLLPPRLSSPIGIKYQWDFENSGVIESYDVTLCINALNETPIARNDTYTTHAKSTLDIAGLIYDEKCKVEDNESSQNQLLVNDTDDHHHNGPCLAAELLALPKHASNDFSASFGNDGRFSYTPSGDDEITSDSFSYRVYDGELYSEPATVKIEISHADTRPMANLDFYRVSISSSNNRLDVLQNDSNPLPQHLKISAIVVPPGSGGSALIQPDQTILYTPAVFFSGVEYLAYAVENALGETDSAWVAVRVR